MTETIPFSPRLSAAGVRAFDLERWAGNTTPAADGWVGLHQGDPCFPTPRHIVEAAFRAVAEDYTHYPPPPGDPALREALVARMNERAVRRHSLEDVFVTAGGTEAIFCALTAYVEPGDDVLLFDPSYSLFKPIIQQIGATPVFVPMSPDFRLDPDSLRAAVTERTRMIIVNNPVNPTGTVFTRAELELLASVAIEADALVLADEVYDHLVYDGEFVSTLELPELADRLLYVNSFSKTYAMTGWRIGWLGAQRELALGAQIVHRNCVGTVNWPTQRAALAAVTGPQDAVAEMYEGYRVRRDVLVRGLADAPGVSIVPTQGTFYAFVGFDEAFGVTSERVTQLLRDRGVVLRSGTEYGSAGEGYLRLSFAASVDDLEVGASRITDFFKELDESSVSNYVGQPADNRRSAHERWK